jgi:hypothetical protein
MRYQRFLIPVLAVTMHGWLFAAPGLAQRGGTGRSVSAIAAEPDLLRPYGSRDQRVFFAEKEKRVYAPPPAAPPLHSRVSSSPGAAVFTQGARDYFPAIRAGRGPNGNAINPRSLCVPGRRAMIPR